MSNYLGELKGSVAEPQQEIFKVGPEEITEFIGKLIVFMGGHPSDIQHISVRQDKKRLKIVGSLDKDSKVFCSPSDNSRGLALLGSSATDEVRLSDDAKKVLREFGYYHHEDDDGEDREVYMVSLSEYKKSVDIEFNDEVTLAIITDSNFCDQYFVVDAVEEVIHKKKDRKKYSSKKFKGKKRTVVMAHVQRSYNSDGGFRPEQVLDWASGVEVDDEDDD